MRYRLHLASYKSERTKQQYMPKPKRAKSATTREHRSKKYFQLRILPAWYIPLLEALHTERLTCLVLIGQKSARMTPIMAVRAWHFLGMLLTLSPPAAYTPSHLCGFSRSLRGLCRETRRIARFGQAGEIEHGGFQAWARDQQPNSAADSVRDAEIVTGSIPGPERSGLTPVAEWPEALASLQGLAGTTGAPTGPVSPLFAGVCRYYHDCFSADSRGGVLNNVLDKNQAEYLVFADGAEELITGLGYRMEVPLSLGVTAQNAADVNRREKFLI